MNVKESTTRTGAWGECEGEHDSYGDNMATRAWGECEEEHDKKWK